jgi:hypothetical protein
LPPDGVAEAAPSSKGNSCLSLDRFRGQLRRQGRCGSSSFQWNWAAYQWFTTGVVPESWPSVGRYELVTYLYSRGPWHCWRATDNRSGQAIHLRFLKPGLPATWIESLQKRLNQWASFQSDRLIASQWDTASTTRDTEPARMVSRPWVDGLGLRQWLMSHGAVGEAVARAVVRAVAAELAPAAKSGCLPSHLYPANLIVTAGGRFLVTDASIWHVSDLHLVGSRRPMDWYAYTAPELFDEAAEMTEPALVFGLICLLFHLTTGELPFPASNPERMARQVREGAWRRHFENLARMQNYIVETFSKGLSVDPTQRFQTLEELSDRLGHPATVPVRPLFPKKTKGLAFPWLGGVPRQRAGWRGGAWWGAGAAAAASLLLAVSLWRGQRAGSSGASPPLLHLFHRATSPAASREEHSAAAPGTITVDRIWAATGYLVDALQQAAPGETVLLKSPGPYILSGLEIVKPLAIRGAENVTPVFILKEAASVRVTAPDVEFQNVHFVRLGGEPPNPAESPRLVALKIDAARCVLRDCSFQAVTSLSASKQAQAAALQWNPLPEDSAWLKLENIYVRDHAFGIWMVSHRYSALELAQGTFLGGSAVILMDVNEGAGRVRVRAERLSVYGPSLCSARFSRDPEQTPLVDLQVSRCLLIPQDVQVPLLHVRYPRRLVAPLAKVTWSGSSTVVPQKATYLQVDYGPGVPGFSLSSVVQWRQFWGPVETGIVGSPLPLLAELPPGYVVHTDFNETEAPVGAGMAQHRFPDPKVLQRLVQALDNIME